MKKLVLMAAVLFGAAMVSCGGGESTDNAADSANVETTEVETVVANVEEKCDSACNEAGDSAVEVIDAVVADAQ